jgi:nucleotide-binding universal stress UspA family protein
MYVVVAQVASVVRLVEGAGDVREALCRHVKEEGINTLVMGNTGKSGLQRVLLGSLSEYCVRYAECAVVVVK